MENNAGPKRSPLRRWSLRVFCLALLSGVAYVAFQYFRPLPPLYRPGAETMNAIRYRVYGPPDVLHLEQARRPLPEKHQVLIEVRAASVNPLDWHYMEGIPYIVRMMGFGFRKPNDPRLGTDVAGVVSAVGELVTRFNPGDEVFGISDGAFADYALAPDNLLAMKPARISFEQAAAVPVAAVTALQGLRDKGQLKPGQKVLINGASGGVGTFAVQIAKLLGAEVTGVCSTRNVELVRSLGADHVIDYTKEDFTQGSQRYDLILDNVANRGLMEVRHVMNPRATYVLIGGGGREESRSLVGSLTGVLKAALLSRFVSQNFGMFIASINRGDLEFLAGLIGDQKLTPVIDRTYPLNEVPGAMTYLEAGHARGKVVITVAAAPTAP
jgi:NADPH:quinone reductase-like Zn-dependent oxidoreductase